MIIDTHTHLYLEEFQNDGIEAVNRAIHAGVEKMIFPNVDLATIAPMKSLQSRFPGNLSMAMGLHPTEVGECWQEDLHKIEEELRGGDKYVAVGEIGIDMYWDKTFRAEQMEVFSRQIDWALELDLPIIIHCREGLDEILEVFETKEKLPRGVFHSFGGSVEDVKRIRRYSDFYFGINGIVTFKNSKLREVLPEIGVERILLETDAPYLAPVPHRGKRNESAYIIHTAAHVAQNLSIGIDALAEITTQSAMALFGLE